ncbi:hypothetical protein SNEBB_011384 [Seison nebaliae]|nr:hypothetical protein SNEBB_011384 [Seison nebaliae]
MDIVLNYCDEYFFTPFVYPTTIEPDIWYRQLISLFVITTIGGYILYFLAATVSYLFIFDHRLMRHPKYLKNQIKMEISEASYSLFQMSFLTIIMFFAEVRNYSYLFDDCSQFGIGKWIIPINIITFILFTDCLIYWIHRALHHRLLYTRLHKLHHKWKVPTPYASHAFHPLDGFSQSLPYHIYPFVFPLHKWTYLGLFVFVNIWTVSIHDGDFRVPSLLRPFINGAAHHMDHHLFYNYNYGQFFTFWDKIGSSIKNPSAFEDDGPLDQIIRLENEQSKKTE